ncbi:MAG: hypothetical protein AB8H03_00840 [Saprospiraceae bacterium]
MKKQIWVFYILLFATVHYAQVPELSWGQEKSAKGVGKWLNYAPIGYTKDYYFVKSKAKKQKELIQYDLQNNLIRITPLAFEYEGDEVDIFKIINTAQGNYLLGSNHKKKQKKTFVHFSIIYKDGEIGKELMHLYAYDYKKSSLMGPEDIPNKDAFGIKLSPDSTKVIFTNVLSNEEPRKRKHKEQYFIKVYDERMEKIWEQKLEFTEADRDIEIDQFEISNKGTVYLLTKTNVKGRLEKWLPNFNYAILKVNEKGIFKKIEVKLEKNYPKNAYLYEHPDGSFYLFGYYTEKKKRDVFRKEHGVFMIKYNSDMEEVFQKQNRWEDDFYNELVREHKIDRIPTFISDYDILNNEFFIEEMHVNHMSNSITFVSEHRFSRMKQRPSERDFTKHHANYLIISSLDFDGKLLWTASVSKDTEKRFSNKNFVSSYKDGNLFLVFEDKKTLKERIDSDEKRKFSTSYTDIARVDENGKVDLRETIFTSKEIGLSFDAYRSINLSNDLILLLAYSLKSAQCGILKLP